MLNKLFRSKDTARKSAGYVRVLTILLLTAGLVLSGCSAGTGGATSGTSNAETVETTQPTTLEPTPSPIPTPTPLPTPAMPYDPLVEAFFGPLPTPQQVVEFEHNELRAIYLGAGARIDTALQIARETEVNAVVIDLKESDGVKYDSQVPMAVDNDVIRKAYNLTSVIERFHAEGVLVIGRIVCYKDPLLAEARPDLTIQDERGNPLYFTRESKKAFLSPYNMDVWQYNVDLAKEAIALGVDEIQFDYVRFPTGGTTSGESPYFGEDGQVPSRIQAINRFLQFAKIKIQDDLGIPVGADVFAIVISSQYDGKNIGQDWPTLGLTGIDNVSPMIYPSHYANAASNGQGQQINDTLFTKPDLFPYEVMLAALTEARTAEENPDYQVANRPYLQAFTASWLHKGYYMEYGPDEIRAQIQAVRDAGYNEWICWNSGARYPIEAFDPEPEQE